MTAEHVITGRDDAGTLERPEGAYLFYDNDQALIARRVLADAAG